MISKLAWVGLVSSWVVACSGETIGIDGGVDGAKGDGATGEGGGNDGASDSGSDGMVGNCNAPAINLTFTGCPAAPTCGGSIADGMYYYTTGCIPDPWAQAKQQCQALVVSNEKGTVKGCVTFAAGFVTRDVQSSYSATLAVPQSCLLNATCSQLETGLKVYFPTATCAASSGGCTCMVSSSYTGTGLTTYTTTNNQIVTGTNNHYDYCINGGPMGVQWASGPNREPGIYSLTKQ